MCIVALLLVTLLGVCLDVFSVEQSSQLSGIFKQGPFARRPSKTLWLAPYEKAT